VCVQIVCVGALGHLCIEGVCVCGEGGGGNKIKVRFVLFKSISVG
jgi:hypothetical protein